MEIEVDIYPRMFFLRLSQSIECLKVIGSFGSNITSHYSEAGIIR